MYQSTLWITRGVFPENMREAWLNSFHIIMLDTYKNPCLMHYALKETYWNITSSRVPISAFILKDDAWLEPLSPRCPQGIHVKVKLFSQGGNQQRADMEIEAEQLTLTFWYGPTRKRWCTYLSTRLVFPTLSFPNITTLASTRIAVILSGQANRGQGGWFRRQLLGCSVLCDEKAGYTTGEWRQWSHHKHNLHWG